LATYHAIAATGQAILGLLADACPKPEFSGIRFALYQTSDLQKPEIEEGLSLYLYRVAVNGSIRNPPPRLGPDGRRYRPSLLIDLHYLLTAWAKTAARQQRLLGWAMRTLEDTPILPQGLLNHYTPEREVFRPNETVEIILESVGLQDLVNIWEVAKQHQQPSATYLVRAIALESGSDLSEMPLVQTREFDYARDPAQ
jgi:hypothetical protein